MARFINDAPTINATFDPISFQEATALPMFLQARDERNINEAEEAFSKYLNIRVPENEQALGVYNSYKENLRKQADDLASMISQKGSNDDDVINRLRSLKRGYNEQVGANGAIGKLADIRTTVDAQRGTARETNIARGYNDEHFEPSFNPQLNSYYEGLDYDRLVNDPNYSPNRFIANTAPNRETVESFLNRNNGNIGYIDTSHMESDVKALPDGNGGYTLTYTGSNKALSSNQRALNELLGLTNAQINDPNSELMQSLRYENPNLSEDELKQKARKEAEYRINMRLRSRDAEGSDRSIDIIQGQAPIIAGSNSTDDGDDTTSKDDKTSNLVSDLRNYQAAEEDFLGTENHIRIGELISGEEFSKLENLEREYAKATTSSARKIEIENQIIKLKRTGIAITQKVNEDMRNPNNQKVMKESIAELSSADKNMKIGGTTVSNILNKEGIPGLLNAKAKNDNYFRSGSRNTLRMDMDNNYSFDVSDTDTQFDIVTQPNGKGRVYGKGKFKLGMIIPSDATKITVNSEAEMLNIIAGKRGVQSVSPEESKEFFKNYKESKNIKRAIKEVSINFAEKQYAEGSTVSVNSHYHGFGAEGEGREKLKKSLENMGTNNILIDAFNDDSNSVIDSSGNTIRFKDMGANEKEKLRLQLAGGEISFGGIVERPGSRKSAIMYDIKVKEGEVYNTYQVEYNARGTNTTSRNSVGSETWDAIINSLNPVDAALVRSIKENDTYAGVYVDDASIGASGVSKHQLKQMKLSADANRKSDHYQKASPITRADRANIVHIPTKQYGDFYSFNYTLPGNNSIKSLEVGDYLNKEFIHSQMSKGVKPSTDNLYDLNSAISLNISESSSLQDLTKAKTFVDEISMSASMMSNANGRTPSIYIPDPALQKEVNDLVSYLMNPNNANKLVDQYQQCVGLYSKIKNTKLYHKQKTKGI